jgi:hypothetical protein
VNSLFLILTVLLSAVHSKAQDPAGFYHCRLDYLNQDHQPVGGDEKKEPLRFDHEDRYWYGEIHFPEFGISASYNHKTVSFSGEESYWGYMRIQHKDLDGGISAAEGHVPLSSELILQVSVPELRLEEGILVRGLKLRCSYQN